MCCFFSFLLVTVTVMCIVLTCSQPTPGYFTDDETLDFLLQIPSGTGMKKVNLGDSESVKTSVRC